MVVLLENYIIGYSCFAGLENIKSISLYINNYTNFNNSSCLLVKRWKDTGFVPRGK